MMTDEEKAQTRAAYLRGDQTKNADGTRLWDVIAVNHTAGDEGDQYPGGMFECSTAQGPTIWCGRDRNGRPRLQIEDEAGGERVGGPVVEEFVAAMELALAETVAARRAP